MLELKGRHAVWYCVVGGFLLLLGGAWYWQIWQGPALVTHPANPRYREERRWVWRGGIYDRRGEVIAESFREATGYRRIYRGTPGLAATVGYFHRRYGTAGLEKAWDRILMGYDYPGASLFGRLRHWWKGLQAGYDLITTLDLRLQRAVEEALSGQSGAVVVMDVRCGHILAMASMPGFDPGNLDREWESLQEAGTSPLFNRAVAGFYPPGSTFKVVVLAAALSAGIAQLTDKFTDAGRITVKGHTITNEGERAWGQISLLDALVVSSNTVFVDLAQRVGAERLLDTARRFGLGKAPELGIPTAGGRLPPEDMSTTALVETGIGQGRLISTPLQMALVAQAIANDGLLLQPVLVQAVRDRKGRIVAHYSASSGGVAGEAAIIREVRRAMREVVRRGTGRQAALPQLPVAGKTGSAQNPGGRPHAWFIGMAPATRPQVCLAIVVENGGSGGAVAAPVARKVFEACWELGYAGMTPEEPDFGWQQGGER